MMRYHYQDYITLHGRKDFADTGKVPNKLALSTLQEFVLGGHNFIQRALKRAQRNTKYKRDSPTSLEGANCYAVERAATGQKASRVQGPQYYDHKELNSPNNLNELGRGLQSPDKNAAQPTH